jgi:uncharacterized membrane protein
MESRAKLFGHAIHPYLIVFPLGLLSTAVVFDLIYLFSANSRWADISFWMMASGVIGGLLAAIFGLIDYLAIPKGTRAKFIGMWHGLGNLLVMGLFLVSLLLRYDNPARPGTVAILLGFLGAGLALLTGWLGGELVERLGVGVDDGAHLNSPNSMSGKPASTDTNNSPEARAAKGRHRI